MPTPYAPLAVANTFVSQFGHVGGIEHMKLQKLVYCSYGWLLSETGLDGNRLTIEGPEIWKHGPVFPSLYQNLKGFGRRPIASAQSIRPFSEAEQIDHDDHDVRALIDWIWGKYGHLSSFMLSDMTHRPGTPWHRVATENNFRIAFNTAIPDEYILEEFAGLREAGNVYPSSTSEGLNGGRRPAA